MIARSIRPQWFEAQPRSVEGIAPPHDLDAEACVRTAMLIVPGFVDRVCPPLEPSHFHSEINRRCVESILAVRASDGEVDPIRVLEHITETGRLAQIGGAKTLSTPSRLNEQEQREAISAARTVWSCFHRREIALHCQQTLAALYHGGVEMAELLDGIEQRTYELCRAASRAGEAAHVSEGLAAVVRSLASGENPVTIPSGLQTYDDAIDEMRIGELSIVGAGTGIGKTSFALGVLTGAAKRGYGGLYESTEMTHVELSHRMLASEAGLSVKLLRRPKTLRDAHRMRFVQAAERLRALPIHIDAEPFERGKTVSSIRAQARRIASALERKGTPLRLIIVDYLQDLNLASTDRNSSEWQRLRDASSALKALAVELKVHVMALSQLTVSDKAPKDYEPGLHDLAGSKAISRPASIVAILSRDPNDVPDKKDPRTIAKLLIRKSRNGGQSKRSLVFHGPLCRFEDGDPEPQEDE